MGVDIRVDVRLPRHWKYKKLKRLLGCSPMEPLVVFWGTVAEQIPNGALDGWTADDIEHAAEWEGGKGVFSSAMVDSGLLDKTEGGFYPHDWHDHQPWVVGAKERSELARIAGKASAKARKEKKINPTEGQRGVDGQFNGISTEGQREPNTRTPSPSPIPLPKSKKEPKTCALPPDGVTPTTWADFQALRKAKRAPLTITALDGIRSEAVKAGLSLEVVLAMCCKRGWQSFEAAWHKGEVSQIPHAQQKTQKEIEEDEIYRKALKREGIDV